MLRVANERRNLTISPSSYSGCVAVRRLIVAPHNKQFFATTVTAVHTGYRTGVRVAVCHTICFLPTTVTVVQAIAPAVEACYDRGSTFRLKNVVAP